MKLTVKQFVYFLEDCLSNKYSIFINGEFIDELYYDCENEELYISTCSSQNYFYRCNLDTLKPEYNSFLNVINFNYRDNLIDVMIFKNKITKKETLTILNKYNGVD